MNLAEAYAAQRITKVLRARAQTPADAVTPLFNVTLKEGHVYHLEGKVWGVADDFTAAAAVAATFTGLAGRDYGGAASKLVATGNPAVVKVPSDYVGACVTTTVAGNVLTVNIVGIAATPMTWEGVLEVREVAVPDDA